MSSQNKTALFCVEQGLKTSKPAFEWALKHLMQEGDTLHVVTVLPPIDFSPTPGDLPSPPPKRRLRVP